MFCGLLNYFVEATTLARSWPREGLVPFVLSKGTKTAVSRNASLRSWPLPCKTGKTWAGIIFPRGSFPSAHAKTSYALLPHSPALFCPFSPEAVLMTGEKKSFHKELITSPLGSALCKRLVLRGKLYMQSINLFTIRIFFIHLSNKPYYK